MSLRSIKVPFKQWLPDQGLYGNPGMVAVDNALPTATGYKPFPDLEIAQSATALMGRPVATHWIRWGQVYIFAAEKRRLWRRTLNGAWENVNRTANYASATSGRWEFASFGPYVIAVTKFVPPQIFDIRSDTEFHDLEGAPDDAATVGVIRDFVVLGDVGGDGFGANYLRWSGYNNLALWTPSLSTQSDFQPLAEGGEVQHIVSGTDGYIFMQDAVYKMTYVGPPTIFRFDSFSGRGTKAPRSVVRIDNSIFYYDHAGFYRFDMRNGTFQPIGNNRVCLLYTSPSPRDRQKSRMPSSA